MAKVGSVEVARSPEVRQLRTQLRRAEQELDMLKKALVIFGQPARRVPISTSASAGPKDPNGRCCAWHPVPIMRGGDVKHPRRNQPGK